MMDLSALLHEYTAMLEQYSNSSGTSFHLTHASESRRSGTSSVEKQYKYCHTACRRLICCDSGDLHLKE